MDLWVYKELNCTELPQLYLECHASFTFILEQLPSLKWGYTDKREVTFKIHNSNIKQNERTEDVSIFKTPKISKEDENLSRNPTLYIST